MDKIINVLLLIIIFVFDPLAISLVIAANFAFDKAYPKKKYKENLYGEFEEDDGWDEFIEEETFDAEKKPVNEDFDWEAAEKRMEIIGQNGNDGEHYADEVEVDPSLTLRQKDGKQINLKDYIQQFQKPIKGPIDDETKTY